VTHRIGRAPSFLGLAAAAAVVVLGASGCGTVGGTAIAAGAGIPPPPLTGVLADLTLIDAALHDRQKLTRTHPALAVMAGVDVPMSLALDLALLPITGPILLARLCRELGDGDPTPIAPALPPPATPTAAQPARGRRPDDPRSFHGRLCCRCSACRRRDARTHAPARRVRGDP